MPDQPKLTPPTGLPTSSVTPTEGPIAEQPKSRPALQPNASAALQQQLDAPAGRREGEGTGDRGDLGGKCFTGEVQTAFASAKTLGKLKAMVANAKPQLVTEVADSWKNIHDHLVTGGGSVKSDFDKAVEQVLKHWEGDSADEFAKKAKKISKQITDCATYARYTSIAMGDAAETLGTVKPKIDELEEPGTAGRALDKIGDGFTRNDDNWRKELEGKGGAQKALDGHDGDLSAGKEEQLKAAALMETLAITYTTQTRTMGSWKRAPKNPEPGEDYPGEPGGIAPVPTSVTPDRGSTGAAVPGANRANSATGGSTSKPTSPGAIKSTPAPGTKVDGISGGTATGTGRGGATTGTPAGGGLGSGTGAGSGGAGGAAGGPGLVGQASGNRGVAGAGARGAAGGRPPAGLGGGAGAGAGGSGAAGAGARGPLARSRGGKLDTPEQGQGAARQGGQGLHSSRGGTAAGDRGRNTTGLMRGGVGGNNSRRGEEENSQGQRPDYLVEDEETWMPERRDVTPPTIN